MSLGTPIPLALFKLAGIEAADEQVDMEVAVAGNMFCQKALTPLLPAAIYE